MSSMCSPIYIDVLGMQNSKRFEMKNEYSWNVDIVWDVYQSEMRLRTLPQTLNSWHNRPKETQSLNIEEYLVPCTWKGEHIELEDRCKISVRKNVCDYSDIIMKCGPSSKYKLFTMVLVCSYKPACTGRGGV